jgi:hypothetical protein
MTVSLEGMLQLTISIRNERKHGLMNYIDIPKNMSPSLENRPEGEFAGIYLPS